jgi:hypothetical protein
VAKTCDAEEFVHALGLELGGFLDVSGDMLQAADGRKRS